jgi:hypothetical protein
MAPYYSTFECKFSFGKMPDVKECEINNTTESERQGLLVKRCRFLEEANCASIYPIQWHRIIVPSNVSSLLEKCPTQSKKFRRNMLHAWQKAQVLDD